MVKKVTRVDSGEPIYFCISSNLGEGEATGVYSGMHSYNDLGRVINTNEDYLEGMKELILKIDKEERVLPEEFYQAWLGRLAFHLHGFAEQAREFGDDQVADRALKLAEGIITERERQAILARRIKEPGKLAITLEEVKNMER